MIKVTRNFWYDTPKGILLYSENSPFEQECEHQICNCTKSVQEKPAGQPKQIKQALEFIHKDNDYTYEVSIDSDGCNFTLRWPGEVWDKEHRWCAKNHAYYWFNVNSVYKNLQIEMIKEGYGQTDCFFGHMYLGNKIDISRFFNGHSQSRIVDLSKLREDELWMHFCMNGEAYLALKEGDEAQDWRLVYAIHDRIASAARSYELDKSPVEQIRERAENNVHMLSNIEYLCRWFSWVTRNLEKTEMFRCADYCYQCTI